MVSREAVLECNLIFFTMKSRKYRSSLQVLKTSGELFFSPSQTIPDQAPKMRELLQRHINGITDNVSQQVSYTGDLPDLRGLEPHELNAMIDQQRSSVQQLQELKDRQVIELRELQDANKRKRDLELLKKLKEQEL